MASGLGLGLGLRLGLGLGLGLGLEAVGVEGGADEDVDAHVLELVPGRCRGDVGEMWGDMGRCVCPRA